MVVQLILNVISIYLMKQHLAKKKNTQQVIVTFQNNSTDTKYSVNMIPYIDAQRKAKAERRS
jgi:hypothetical protein